MIIQARSLCFTCHLSFLETQTARPILKDMCIFRQHLLKCQPMNIPDRVITTLELKRGTGERGARKLIAYKGIVYDITDCPRWRLEIHENLHFPGQDLTGELEEAPHAEDVFSRPCVIPIGRLQTDG